MAACAMMEPIFPEPAEIPCEVERYRVGKHSPGTMKVVVLGPKLKNFTVTSQHIGRHVLR